VVRATCAERLGIVLGRLMWREGFAAPYAAGLESAALTLTPAGPDVDIPGLARAGVIRGTFRTVGGGIVRCLAAGGILLGRGGGGRGTLFRLFVLGGTAAFALFGDHVNDEGIRIFGAGNDRALDRDLEKAAELH